MKPIPSNAHLWVNCTGSVQLMNNHKIPNIDGEVSEARKEGLAFHELAQSILTSGDTLDGGFSSHGIPFDDDMREAAVEYATDIMTTCAEPTELLIESKIDTSCIYEDTYGYVDACVIDAKTSTITIWDAKYGHTLVDPYENWQMISYAYAIITERLNGLQSNGWTVVLKVYQPRGFHRDGTMRSWCASADDLRAHFNVLRNQAHLSMGGNARCTTGSHCTVCPARHACDTYRRVNYAILDQVGESIGTDLTGANLAVEVMMMRRAQKILNSYVKAIEEQAIAESKQGKALPGLTVEQQVGRLSWRKDVDQQEVIAMGDLMGVDLRKPRELLTPSQCNKKIDAEVIEGYSERVVKGYKLVELTEDRIKQIFNVE